MSNGAFRKPEAKDPQDDVPSLRFKEREGASVPLYEIGSTGVRISGGQVYESRLSNFKGSKRAIVIREMSETDATIAGLLQNFTMLGRNVEYTIETEGTSDGDKKAVEHIESCLDDMEDSFEDYMTTFFSVLPFGFTFHETNFKMRMGEDPPEQEVQLPPDAKGGPGKSFKQKPPSSVYDDGLVGWWGWPIRRQDTITRWNLDNNGRVLGAFQRVEYALPGKVGERYIPLTKALHITTDSASGNPEGRSILEAVYRAFFFKRNFEDLVGIGVKRDLVGYPVMSFPKDANIWLDANVGKLSKAETLVANLFRDEYEGLVKPEDVKLELLSSGGPPRYNIPELMQWLRLEIAIGTMTEFALVGHEGVGSLALKDTATRVFLLALDGVLKSIANAISDQAIRPLIKMNESAFKVTEYPKIKFGTVDVPSVEAVIDSLVKLAGAGAPVFPDPQLQTHLYSKMQVPVPQEEDLMMRDIEREQMEQEAELFEKKAEMDADAKAEADKAKADGEGEEPAFGKKAEKEEEPDPGKETPATAKRKKTKPKLAGEEEPDFFVQPPPLAAGGAGSGNFGHAGRPGMVGGSAPGSGTGGDSSASKQGQISLETSPGRSTGVLEKIHSASFEDRRRFMRDVEESFHDNDGRDELLSALGLKGHEFEVVGVWQGEQNPGIQIQLERTDDPPDVLRTKVEAYAAAMGKAMFQEGVGYHVPRYDADTSKHNIAEVNIGRTLDREEMGRVYSALKEQMPGLDDEVALIGSRNGVRVLNWAGATPNEDFHEKLAIAASMADIGDATVDTFAVDSDVVTNDWRTNVHGQGYDSKIAAAGPDFQRRANSVLARTRDVYEEWSEDLEEDEEQKAAAEPDVLDRFGQAVERTVEEIIEKFSNLFRPTVRVVVPQSNTTAEILELLKLAREERALAAKAFGGPGSGHHGHAGRPGERGGSAPGDGGGDSGGGDKEVGGSSSVREVESDFGDDLSSRASVREVESDFIVPPEGRARIFDPDPLEDRDGDGVADHSRVGVPAMHVPDTIGRLPELNAQERDAETYFADLYEADPDGMAMEYRDQMLNGSLASMAKAEKIEDPVKRERAIQDAKLEAITFNTDDAKLLSPDYNPNEVTDAERLASRAAVNVAVHNTANAIAKRAFLEHLDEMAQVLPEDQRIIIVTSGGVASGKSFAIAQAPEVQALADKAAAIWDAAGEANATENPWVLEEARKRGFSTVFTFTDADPHDVWANPERGVIERAEKKGRMVTGRLFAESYVLGPQNFNEFAQKHASAPDVKFAFFDNARYSDDGKPLKPIRVDKMPEKALSRSVKDILGKADKKLVDLYEKGKVKASVFRGGINHRRIWRKSAKAAREWFDLIVFGESTFQASELKKDKALEEIVDILEKNIEWNSEHGKEFEKRDNERMEQRRSIGRGRSSKYINPDGTFKTKEETKASEDSDDWWGGPKGFGGPGSGHHGHAGRPGERGGSAPGDGGGGGDGETNKLEGDAESVREVSPGYSGQPEIPGVASALDVKHPVPGTNLVLRRMSEERYQKVAGELVNAFSRVEEAKRELSAFDTKMDSQFRTTEERAALLLERQPLANEVTAADRAHKELVAAAGADFFTERAFRDNDFYETQNAQLRDAWIQMNSDKFVDARFAAAQAFGLDPNVWSPGKNGWVGEPYNPHQAAIWAGVMRREYTETQRELSEGSATMRVGASREELEDEWRSSGAYAEFYEQAREEAWAYQDASDRTKEIHILSPQHIASDSTKLAIESAIGHLSKEYGQMNDEFANEVDRTGYAVGSNDNEPRTIDLADEESYKPAIDDLRVMGDKLDAARAKFDAASKELEIKFENYTSWDKYSDEKWREGAAARADQYKADVMQVYKEHSGLNDIIRGTARADVMDDTTPLGEKAKESWSADWSPDDIAENDAFESWSRHADAGEDVTMNTEYFEDHSLYRGVGTSTKAYVPNAVESYSVSRSVAEGFGGSRVIEDQIDPRRILVFQGASNWKAEGLGLKENEVLVLSDVPNWEKTDEPEILEDEELEEAA